MLRKQPLPTRLEPELIERLKRFSLSISASIPDTISLALDALERERNTAQTITERVENIEENLTSLVDLMTRLSQKMDEAGVNEKERLKSLLQLLESKLLSHDQAEQMRFDKLRPHIF